MKSISRVAAALVASTLLLGACGSGSDDSAAGGTLKIAVAGPMTGDNAIYGQDALAGVEFAAKQINDAGGIAEGPHKGKKLEVVVFDDVADPNQGASVAQKICDDKDIIATFGHSNSSVTLAAQPIYESCANGPVPLLVSYSSNPAVTQGNHPTTFRVIPDDGKMGAEMAAQALNQLGMKNVAVLASDDDYGDGLKVNFEATAKSIGLGVAKIITTTAKQKDFTPQLTELKNAGADGLVLLNTYTDAALQIKQAAQMGWDVQAFVTAGSNSPELINIAGADAAEGTAINALFDSNSAKEAVVEFIADFQAANDGKSPGEATALAYDSVFVLVAALEAGAEDRVGVVEQIESIGTFNLPVIGELTFNENGEPTLDPANTTTVVLQVKDGAIGTFAK